MSYMEETERAPRPQPIKSNRLRAVARICSYIGFALAVGFSAIVILGFLN